MPRSKIKIITVVLLLIVGSLWLTRYRTTEFKGGISMRDSGLFMYPRYHAYLGYVALDTPGEHRFTVRGLPSEDMWLQFDVSDASLSDRPILTSLTTTLSAKLLDSGGHVLCSVTGQLSDERSWVLTGWEKTADSHGYAGFWNRNGCEFENEIFISRFKTYTLVVNVTAVDPHSPKLIFVPVLKGGGIELP